ncbi:MAG: RNA polymerase sigma-70 factor [Cyclobacteriaceae bacterium]
MEKDSKIRKTKSRSLLEETFEKIYLENFDRLFLFATTITKSKDLAKDVVSDVFVELWDNNSRLSRIKEIESYLFISVKNHAIRLVSKKSHQLKNENIDSALASIDRINPEEVLLAKELFDFIERTVIHLPDQSQLVFRLAKDKQMSNKDIAAELGISVSTVKSQLIRATTTVREAILEKFADEKGHPSFERYGIISVVLSILHASLAVQGV